MHAVERWIQEGEHQRQDFKFLVSDSRKIARTLCAFANTDGGRLLIGVKDNGKISGIRSDEEAYMIDTAAKYFTEPKVEFQAKAHRVQGKVVLEVEVSPSPQRPHRIKQEDGSWVSYLRIDDEDCLSDKVVRYLWKFAQDPRPVVLAFTEIEQLLLGFLKENTFITPRRYSRLAGISLYKAVQIIAKLTSWGVLAFRSSRHGLVYVLSETEA